jgi:hypothetical protein
MPVLVQQEKQHRKVLQISSFLVGAIERESIQL